MVEEQKSPRIIKTHLALEMLPRQVPDFPQRLSPGFHTKCTNNNRLFRITPLTDRIMTKAYWTIKTLVREADAATSPRRPGKRYPTEKLSFTTYRESVEAVNHSSSLG